MDITILWTFLPHTDADASLAFYRDVLGFTVTADVGSGTKRWITVEPAGHPGTSIVLHPVGVDRDITDEQRRVVTEMVANGTYATIVLATADVDATFDKVRAAGAKVVQEPTDQPWGVRDCAFADPAGNQVRINQVR
jgi:predicted enzyme related to lactoylglutathione lyase